MKALSAYIFLSLHIASATLVGKRGFFSYEKNKKLDAIPFASYKIQEESSCMLKCLAAENACIAYHHNTNSQQCSLLAKLLGGPAIEALGYISGIRHTGELVRCCISYTYMLAKLAYGLYYFESVSPAL